MQAPADMRTASIRDVLPERVISTARWPLRVKKACLLMLSSLLWWGSDVFESWEHLRPAGVDFLVEVLLFKDEGMGSFTVFYIFL